MSSLPDILFMTDLTIEDLKNFIDNLPEDYTISFRDEEGLLHSITDSLEIDLSMKRLVLKSR